MMGCTRGRREGSEGQGEEKGRMWLELSRAAAVGEEEQDRPPSEK
jgi:hypothetical protein